ncbi:hypothetical protein EON81_15460 [bacterium]|nr:MAG: hypothetical protein EON81_15460 [bacterium]
MPVTTYHSANGKTRGQSAGGVRRDYASDGVGSVVATVDAAGAVENTYRYKPYGKTLAKTGSAADPTLLWTAATGSRATRLAYAEQYNRARHYGSAQRAWTTKDPLWPEEAAYAYVHGNPATFIDPSGMSIWVFPPAIWPLICPPAEVGTPPCGQGGVAGGGCPNQSGKGPIDLKRFDQPGSPTDPAKCDPAKLDLPAINGRISYVQGKIKELCGENPDAPIPPGNFPYLPYMGTRPCAFLGPDKKPYKFCAIQCLGNPAARNKLGVYFGNRPQNGIGCLVCCLSAHENHHCGQIIGGSQLGTYGSECDGWKKELECLKRVIGGGKCSS